MKLVLQEFISLDGVTQGPGSPDEDRSDGFDRGGWFVPFLDERFLDRVKDWVGFADAFLFGHRTYDAFAQAWPAMNDPADPVATALNGLPKYVAAQSPVAANWGPVNVVTGDVLAQVAALKARPGRELQVHGSTTLARSLLSAGLFDELRLVVTPVVIGKGRKLFLDDMPERNFATADASVTPSGLTVLVLRAAGAVAHGTYGT